MVVCRMSLIMIFNRLLDRRMMLRSIVALMFFIFPFCGRQGKISGLVSGAIASSLPAGGAVSYSAPPIRDDPIVTIDTGRVRGTRTYVSSVGKIVATYLGIPYAKPPVGHLRFRHPRPIDAWTGIYNATKLPNSCYQEADTEFGSEFWGSNVWNSPTPLSEDCLYLNVFVPDSLSSSSRVGKRMQKSAVMVWIFGGGFYSGTTTLGVYDGKILAAENNIIVVSIGYRVGALGFLALGHPSAPGNAGLFDQLMGLDWVQRNIAQFGGDPNNVTLFGESAGSVSVSLHLLSPLSHGKFQRAILQSGAAVMPWATLTVEEGRSRSMELAYDYLNCSRNTPPRGLTGPAANDASMAEISDCLRLIPAERLVEKQWVSRGPLQFPFIPVIDGVFLPDAPVDLLKRKAFKKCPIIIGSNANEGSTFVMYELKPKYLTLDKKTMTRAEYLDSIERMFFYYPQYPKVLEDEALDAIKFHYSNWLDSGDTDLNIHALDMATGDSQFICPLNTWALAYAEAGQSVYAYWFSQRYSSNPWPAWMGVVHGDEIFFVFGEPMKMKPNFTEDERQLSRNMQRFWTNFAKHRNPNQPSSKAVAGSGRASGGTGGGAGGLMGEWPIHTPDGREYLEFNTRFLGSTDKWAARGRGPRAKECAFWTDYLPGVISSAAQHKASADEPQQCSNHCAVQGNASSYYHFSLSLILGLQTAAILLNSSCRLLFLVT